MHPVAPKLFGDCISDYYSGVKESVEMVSSLLKLVEIWDVLRFQLNLSFLLAAPNAIHDTCRGHGTTYVMKQNESSCVYVALRVRGPRVATTPTPVRNDRGTSRLQKQRYILEL